MESDLDNEGGDVKQDDDNNCSGSGFKKTIDVKRYLILEQNNARALNRLRHEVINTKSPCDIVVSVKNKFDKIRCVCELKRKTFLTLMNGCKKVKELKKLLRELDLIKPRYLIEAINCHRRALQKECLKRRKKHS